MSSPATSIKRIFSGIQPTGIPHLGNYLGAIVNWVNLQETVVTTVNTSTTKNPPLIFYSIVDLHALTLPKDPLDLQRDIKDSAITLLACGITPDASKNIYMFQQGRVKQHAELQWILSTITPMGKLNRMTQFKEKNTKGNVDKALLGLYSYPILMTSDILLYKTTHVPVGDDQKQHLELSRDIANAFNIQFNPKKNDNSTTAPFFPLPQGIFPTNGTSARVMSLTNGSKKMSKSDASMYSRINLDDDKDMIMKKIKKAKTDSYKGFGLTVTNDDGVEEERLEIKNLIGIRASLENKSMEDVVNDLNARNLNTGEMKTELADLLIDRIDPISNEIKRLRNSLDGNIYVDNLLNEGKDKAEEIAESTMQEVRKLVGISSI
jgi:tryptophanyl-tRNA synthetase